MSTVFVNSYKRFTIDLTNAYTTYPTYVLSNENSSSVYCHLSFFLSSTNITNNITIVIDYYNGASIDHTDTYILNSLATEFDKIIRLYTDKAVVTISYTTFTGKLFGIISKNTEKEQQNLTFLNKSSNGNPDTVQPINQSTLYDAFGRLKVSNPHTIFDSFNRYTASDKFATYKDVSSNLTLNADSSLSMTVGAYSTSVVVRETKTVFTYQPGKSLLIMNSFTMNTPQSNLIQRVGYFSPNDGIFLEASGTVINFVKRAQGIDTKVSQSNWNGSRLLGESPDLITLDLSKSQIFWCDIEWLGVGSVRCGFIINGKFYVSHTFHHSNIITGTYMTTACLPIRYEILNTQNSTGGTLKQICSTVITEGGYDAMSTVRHIGTDNFTKTLTSNNVFVPFVTIKLRPDRLDANVLVSQLSIGNTVSNALLQYKILLNANLTGASYFNYDLSSNIMYDISATAVSGGYLMNSGYFNQSNTIELASINDFNLQMGKSLTSYNTYLADTVTVAISCLQGNDPQVSALIGWYEPIGR
jgi:hypothetical protein